MTGFMGWTQAAWEDVRTGERVRLKSGNSGKVAAAWDGQRVILEMDGSLPAPIPLTDGTKLVDVSRSAEERRATGPIANAPRKAMERFGQALLGTDVPEPDLLTALEQGQRAADTAERIKTAVAKFGQPTASAEGVAIQANVVLEPEPSAVVTMIEEGLGAELIAVTTQDEAGRPVYRVPNSLGRLATMSHLYLMHGIFGSNITDDEQLFAVHTKAHEDDEHVAPHEHVSRADIDGEG